MARLLDRVNFKIPGGRQQLFEVCELWIVPPFIKHDTQDALAARWNQTIPLLQSQSPAELAGDAIAEALHTLPDLNSGSNGGDGSGWTIIDFGSGGGGPVPTIEMLVNHGRGSEPPNSSNARGDPADTTEIPFQLSDLQPQLDAWMGHAARSANISFLPQPVDAAAPPYAAISATTVGADGEAAHEQGFASNGRKVFRLYCETFHCFDDATAVAALQSTMLTSDAFAIVELQERTVLSLVAVLLETIWTMLCAVAWFWGDWIHLAFTYLLPVLPLAQYVDGLVGCLRRRTFEEMVGLLEQAANVTADQTRRIDPSQARVGAWSFTHTRLLHTWPAGYMTVITGTKQEAQDTNE